MHGIRLKLLTSAVFLGIVSGIGQLGRKPIVNIPDHQGERDPSTFVGLAHKLVGRCGWVVVVGEPAVAFRGSATML
jgi:hypothetical protein